MKHFSIEELTHTNTGLYNLPDRQVVRNLEALVNNILDPLRELYGNPIKVNSGYRSYLVNKAVKGAISSQHLTGEAADITAGSAKENKILFDLCASLPFDQRIDEFGYKWVHVSYRNNGRKQTLHIK